MSGDFLSINENDRRKFLAQNILEREKEVEHYQFNIDHYNFMLEDLPKGEWHESIAHLRGQATNPNKMSEEQILLIEQYKLRDLIAGRLLTEKVAIETARRALVALRKRLNPENTSYIIKNIEELKTAPRGSGAAN